MANIKVLNMAGQEVESIKVKDEVFKQEYNEALIHQVVVAYLANQRQGTKSTLTRSEVRGHAKKPWRQKGTGRARQGSSRAVQYRGGGIAFGPTPRSHTFKLNRKVRRLALRSALTLKATNNNLTVVQDVKFANIKTKDFKNVLNAFGFDRKVLVVVDVNEDFENAYLSSRNFGNVVMVTVEGLNVYDLQNANKLVITTEAAKKIGEVLTDE